MSWKDSIRSCPNGKVPELKEIIPDRLFSCVGKHGPIINTMIVYKIPSANKRSVSPLGPAGKGELVVWNAICMDEAAMKKIDALGNVKYVVTPNMVHRRDARQWLDRYPMAKFVVPEGPFGPSQAAPVIKGKDRGMSLKKFVTKTGVKAIQADDVAIVAPVLYLFPTGTGSHIASVGDLIQNHRTIGTGFGEFLFGSQDGKTPFMGFPFYATSVFDYEAYARFLYRLAALMESGQVDYVIPAHGNDIHHAKDVSNLAVSILGTTFDSDQFSGTLPPLPPLLG